MPKHQTNFGRLTRNFVTSKLTLLWVIKSLNRKLR